VDPPTYQFWLLSAEPERPYSIETCTAARLPLPAITVAPLPSAVGVGPLGFSVFSLGGFLAYSGDWSVFESWGVAVVKTTDPPALIAVAQNSLGAQQLAPGPSLYVSVALVVSEVTL
jgi:hypothetical protein